MKSWFEEKASQGIESWGLETAFQRNIDIETCFQSTCHVVHNWFVELYDLAVAFLSFQIKFQLSEPQFPRQS
jgi:hypothetical protein